MSVRGHTLHWHSQLACCVRSLTTRDEVLAAMARHITEVVGRSRGAQVCLDQPACTSLTFWGVTDSDSWRDGDCPMGGRTEPLLFDASYPGSFPGPHLISAPGVSASVGARAV